jgi:hypothetical protein
MNCWKRLKTYPITFWQILAFLISSSRVQLCSHCIHIWILCFFVNCKSFIIVLLISFPCSLPLSETIPDWLLSKDYHLQRTAMKTLSSFVKVFTTRRAVFRGNFTLSHLVLWFNSLTTHHRMLLKLTTNQIIWFIPITELESRKLSRYVLLALLKDDAEMRKFATNLIVPKVFFVFSSFCGITFLRAHYDLCLYSPIYSLLI